MIRVNDSNRSTLERTHARKEPVTVFDVSLGNSDTLMRTQAYVQRFFCSLGIVVGDSFFVGSCCPRVGRSVI